MKFITLSILFLLFIVDTAYSFLDKTKDCKCKISISNRIIGGQEAPKSSYPWQISLSIKDNYPKAFRRMLKNSYKIQKSVCGGSVINKFWVLTAAHCVVDGYENLRIGFSDNDLVRMYDEDKFKDIENVYIHPNYSKDNLRNDIALIKLKNPFEFDQSVQPACLPSLENHVNSYGELKISGWGATNHFFANKKTNEPIDVKTTRYLKEAIAFDSSSQSNCPDRTFFICHDIEKTGTNICSGDSGGPLMSTKMGRTSVVGVTSNAVAVVVRDYWKMCIGLSRFTRITYHLDWIRRFIGTDYCT